MARSYGTAVATAATELCVSLAELREHLGFAADNRAEDAKLYAAGLAAEDYCQRYTNRQFVTATLEHLLDRWPTGNAVLNLPRAPLQSVTSISYVDEDGNGQTWSSADYRVITKDEPGFVVLAYGATYPAIRPQHEAITITYVCGYGEPPEVPEALKFATLLLAAHLFEQRTPVIIGTNASMVPLGIRDLLESYRVPDDYTDYARSW